MSSRASKKIHDRQRHATRLMKRILTHFKAAMDEELRPYGVTSAQVKLLWAIRNAPGSSGAHVSRMCEVTPQTAQALIERAEESGWIVRGKDRVNERIVTASLTPAGDELLSTADGLVKRIEAALWKGVPAESVEEVIRVMEQCLHNVSPEEDAWPPMGQS
jgi:DNA-binding MarR family transcriptional regulator